MDRTGVLLCTIGAAFAARLTWHAPWSCRSICPWWEPCLGDPGSRIANLWHDCLGALDGIRRDKKPFEIESGL